MTAISPGKTSRGRKPDLAKIKSYLTATISRQLEINPVPPENRKDAIRQLLEETAQKAKIPMGESL